MELLCSIKTFLNLRLFPSYRESGRGQLCVQTRRVTLSAARSGCRLRSGVRGISESASSLARAFVCGSLASVCVALRTAAVSERRFFYRRVQMKCCGLSGISSTHVHGTPRTAQTSHGHLVQLFIKKITLKTDQN
ncbi:hypothetical protein HJG60_009208 [Phyllostomus discolor]|uniref:Uncharacterized protein n=1 Tax=Phyllostomus discolor TaxID=89673 RepID=A0A834DFU2_9CHIR|nr:hypothetical protein HJG60_009208 [Phyllostomus discolor]